jgi:hypothetical protein
MGVTFSPDSLAQSAIFTKKQKGLEEGEAKVGLW